MTRCWLAAMLLSFAPYSISSEVQVDWPSGVHSFSIGDMTTDPETGPVDGLRIDGSIVLSGKVVLTYESVDGAFEFLWAEFVTSEHDLRRLPRIGGSGPASFWLGPESLERLRRALPQSERASLDSPNSDRLEFSATIEIDGFETAIECDHRNFYAEVKRVVRIESVSAQAQERAGGC